MRLGCTVRHRAGLACGAGHHRRARAGGRSRGPRHHSSPIRTVILPPFARLCTGDPWVGVANASADGRRSPQPEIHKVGPEFLNWSKSLTENPYKSLKVGPKFRPTL
jgi:hypothetical protein